MKNAEKVEKFALSIDETAVALGISRPTVYALMKKQGFPSFRVGGRTLISADGLKAWIAIQTADGGAIKSANNAND